MVFSGPGQTIAKAFGLDDATRDFMPALPGLAVRPGSGKKGEKKLEQDGLFRYLNTWVKTPRSGKGTDYGHKTWVYTH